MRAEHVTWTLSFVLVELPDSVFSPLEMMGGEALMFYESPGTSGIPEVKEELSIQMTGS